MNVHDFADRSLGEFAKAIPYGVYDVANDEGWVSVGDTADTAEFAVESIRRWWNTLGRDRFPEATRLMITADAGGSNGYRVRAWKWHLAQLAAETTARTESLRLLAPDQQGAHANPVGGQHDDRAAVEILEHGVETGEKKPDLVVGRVW